MVQRRKVLSDHKRQGKVLVPPFTATLGPIQEVSWIKTIIPELTWIALIQTRYGTKRGVELITSTARAARDAREDEQCKTFAFTSDYCDFTPTEWKQVRKSLPAKDTLAPIQDAIEPLVAWYPQCPLRFLFTDPPEKGSPEGLQQIKELVASLYNREDREPMLVQATGVWLAFDAELLVVNKDLALAQFPEIDRYPETELSRRVGSGVRAVINMLLGRANEGGTVQPSWPTYFWNRGLETSPCEFDH